MVVGSRYAQRSFVILLALSMFVLCGFSVPGCSSPCERLSKTLCDHFAKLKEPALCQIAKEELKGSSVSSRRCMALNDTWSSEGAKAFSTIHKRYRRNKRRIEKMSFKRAKKRLALEHEVFRKSFRDLLSFSWKVPKQTKKSKRRRIKKKRRRRRRIRRRVRRKKVNDDDDDDDD